MTVEEILVEIAKVRAQRLRRGESCGDAVSADDLDALRLDWLEAELELAHYREGRGEESWKS